jgi:TolA-binding protein
MENQQIEKEAVISELNEKLRLQQESVQAIQQARIQDAERRVKDAAIAVELAKTKNRAATAAMQSGTTIKQIRRDREKVKRSVVTPIANSTVTKQQTSNVSVAKPIAAKKETSKPITVPQTVNDLKKGQQLFAQGKYSAALSLFEREARNSTSQSSVEARYMMGECLYEQKEYDKAIMQYQKIISQHSDDPKAPSAMLKQGMAFERLADNDTAIASGPTT